VLGRPPPVPHSPLLRVVSPLLLVLFPHRHRLAARPVPHRRLSVCPVPRRHLSSCFSSSSCDSSPWPRRLANRPAPPCFPFPLLLVSPPAPLHLALTCPVVDSHPVSSIRFAASSGSRRRPRRALVVRFSSSGSRRRAIIFVVVADVRLPSARHFPFPRVLPHPRRRRRVRLPIAESPSLSSWGCLRVVGPSSQRWGGWVLCGV